MDKAQLLYLVGTTIQLWAGIGFYLNTPGNKKWGARLLLTLPVWPATAVAAISIGIAMLLRKLWRDAEFFPAKALPPPVRGDQLTELERAIDSITAQMEKL